MEGAGNKTGDRLSSNRLTSNPGNHPRAELSHGSEDAKR